MGEGTSLATSTRINMLYLDWKGGDNLPKWDNRTCPRCGEVKSGYPALSRVDNTTEICAECGTEEALMGLTRPSTRGVTEDDREDDSLN